MRWQCFVVALLLVAAVGQRRSDPVAAALKALDDGDRPESPRLMRGEERAVVLDAAEERAAPRKKEPVEEETDGTVESPPVVFDDASVAGRKVQRSSEEGSIEPAPPVVMDEPRVRKESVREESVRISNGLLKKYHPLVDRDTKEVKRLEKVLKKQRKKLLECSGLVCRTHLIASTDALARQQFGVLKGRISVVDGFVKDCEKIRDAGIQASCVKYFQNEHAGLTKFVEERKTKSWLITYPKNVPLGISGVVLSSLGVLIAAAVIVYMSIYFNKLYHVRYLLVSVALLLMCSFMIARYVFTMQGVLTLEVPKIVIVTVLASVLSIISLFLFADVWVSAYHSAYNPNPRFLKGYRIVSCVVTGLVLIYAVVMGALYRPGYMHILDLSDFFLALTGAVYAGILLLYAIRIFLHVRRNLGMHEHASRNAGLMMGSMIILFLAYLALLVANAMLLFASTELAIELTGVPTEVLGLVPNTLSWIALLTVIGTHCYQQITNYNEAQSMISREKSEKRSLSGQYISLTEDDDGHDFEDYAEAPGRYRDF